MTLDPTAGLTRKQLRELRAAQGAAVPVTAVEPDAAEPPVAEPPSAAQLTDSKATDGAEAPADAATAIPLVRPALAQLDVAAPPTPVSGIVMHSAPIVRGPIARPANSLAGVAQFAQVAPVTETAPAGRRALRHSRTSEIEEQPEPVVPPVAIVTETVIAPVEPVSATVQPMRSRRSSRTAGFANAVSVPESGIEPSPRRAVEAAAAPLLHTDPPRVEGVDQAAPVRAEGLFARATDTDVEPLIEGVAAAPVWQAPTRELAFDDIIAARPRGTSASASPTTLIFNPGDMHSALTGPIPSTGELLVTASHEIAPGVAARGHADGAVDDDGTDAVLLDRELPVASSPTPIAAKSAISRSTAGPELVRPAEPEKTNTLTVALVVTGGVLLIAALTTLIIGFMNGAFN